MGKYKQSLMEKNESLDYDYDESLIDYQIMIHEQENYKMTELEEHYYQQYMEGKICGEQLDTALINTNMNLSTGRTSTGERNIPKLRKPRSRK